MNKKIIALILLALCISACSEIYKNTEEKSDVIYEQEGIEKGISEKDELKATIENLEKLNSQREEELKTVENEGSENRILKEETNREHENLKKTVQELNDLIEQQEN
ncbi:hypothetical protein [Christiangramia sp. SM2212]|uniref:Lipoprotein n=1 Tax=Christiangramia sediminicola TaxID=3073267 RepID=A0ABU1ERJ3_9FLAO|nr:hypothetical protein [Christiangramia sp. SM2212]MDR5591012.1 hypothetical protein [Christiangramia sp. SM2212]